MKVKVGDRIATTPGGHVATVTRVDGPNWVVVRWKESGTETGFKGIDSDYWTKAGGGKRRKTTKRKRAYSGRSKTTSARKKAVRKVMRRSKVMRQFRARLFVNRMGKKIRKYATARRVRSAVLDHYNAGRHDEAVEVLKEHAGEIGLSAKKLHDMPTTEAVHVGLHALSRFE